MSLPAISKTTLEVGDSAARREQIIERVRLAQIRGLGGGRFPTANKLTKAESGCTLIVNGLQSEPDNNADLELLRLHTKDVLSGVAIAALASGASAIALALPRSTDRNMRKTTEAALNAELEWLNHSAAEPVAARLVYLQSNHALGEEHLLADALGLLEDAAAKRIHTPIIELGPLCLNLATCHAIGRAVLFGDVLNSRMVSVNGTAQWVDFATPVENLLTPAWINGRHGGYSNSNGTSAKKVDAGVFCVTPPPPEPIAPCIDCGACGPVCPVSLAPDELHRAIELKKTPDATLKLNDCIECGACNEACPSGLWLAQGFRDAKAKLKDQTQKGAAAETARLRVEARNARLSAEKDADEEQRAERLRERSRRGSRSW